MIARALALLVLLPLAAAFAADPPVLRVDGKSAQLEDGLQRSADGTYWITLADARRALDFEVKRLIPRPPAGKRPQPRREQDAWILCGRTRCATYRGKLLGTTEEPAFDLARLARTLGLRLRSTKGVLELRSPARRGTSKRGRIGGLVPDIALPCLDGKTRRLGQHAGKRLLLVTWAPWSPTRDQLQAWAAHHKQRAGRNLELWLAAIDAEGAARVKDYVDTGFDTPVALDRHAALTLGFPMRDVGHWYLIDELGVLRAEGERLDAVALQWIDLHLEEPVIGRARPATPRSRPSAAPTLEQAAARVAAQPKVPAYAFHLAALHLDAGDASAALKVLDDARRRTPGAWFLRKQYWALWQPGRFYAGAIDAKWISAQKKREKDELDWPKRRR